MGLAAAFESSPNWKLSGLAARALILSSSDFFSAAFLSFASCSASSCFGLLCCYSFGFLPVDVGRVCPSGQLSLAASVPPLPSLLSASSSKSLNHSGSSLVARSFCILKLSLYLFEPSVFRELALKYKRLLPHISTSDPALSHVVGIARISSSDTRPSDCATAASNRALSRSDSSSTAFYAAVAR